MRVYYYYQFVYKLVYYNDKTSSANSALGASNRTPVGWQLMYRYWLASPAGFGRLASKRLQKRLFSAFLLTRLWKSRGISTGWDVQNAAIFASPKICPPFVPTPHRLCSAGKRVCKSLMLWSKRELSTEEAAFTIYYQFVYKL